MTIDWIKYCMRIKHLIHRHQKQRSYIRGGIAPVMVFIAYHIIVKITRNQLLRTVFIITLWETYIKEQQMFLSLSAVLI